MIGRTISSMTAAVHAPAVFDLLVCQPALPLFNGVWKRHPMCRCAHPRARLCLAPSLPLALAALSLQKLQRRHSRRRGESLYRNSRRSAPSRQPAVPRRGALGKTRTVDATRNQHRPSQARGATYPRPGSPIVRIDTSIALCSYTISNDRRVTAAREH